MHHKLHFYNVTIIFIIIEVYYKSFYFRTALQIDLLLQMFLA